MRKKDMIVNDPIKIDEIIEKCDCCRIALIDEDKPYIVPLNFAYVRKGDKQFFYFHGAKVGRKITLINRNKYAGFELDTNHKLKIGEKLCNHSFQYQSVIGTGKISLIEDTAEKIRIFELMMNHYRGEGDWKFDEKIVNATAVIKLEVEEMTCKQNN